MTIFDSNIELRDAMVGILAVAVVGFLIFCFLQATVLGDRGYTLYAEFTKVTGVHVGDPILIAGIKVGEVESIRLKDYEARLGLKIRDSVSVRSDAMVSFRSSGLGLVGNQVVSIDPGVSGDRLGPGDVIARTQSARTMQDLIGQWVAGDIVSGG